MARTTRSRWLPIQTLRATLAPARWRIRGETAGGQLTGRTLLYARMLWTAAAAGLVGLYVALLPAFWAQLQTVCSGARCAQEQPSPASAAALRALGLSVTGYAELTLAATLLATLVCFAVAGVIIWRKSDDRMALLVALTEVALGTLLVPAALFTGRSPWQLPALVGIGASYAVLLLLAALFPSGRFVPGWARWLPTIWLTAWAAVVGAYLLSGELLFSVHAAVFLSALAGAVVAQVYRYRVVSGPRERAQTRWVVVGESAAIAIVIAVFAPKLLVPTLGQSGSLYNLASIPAYTLAISLFSLSMGMAILRHRLYDIDIVIRRTLIYSLVTGTLATIYAISTIVLQAGFQAVTRQGSALAAVGSTLAIAALFQPVRHHAKAVVDRRFYRHKYDSARTLETFGHTLRAQTDLAQLSDQLVAVVEETMQPSQVSLWLVRRSRQGEPGAGAWQRADAEGAEADGMRLPKPVPLTDVFAGQDTPTR